MGKFVVNIRKDGEYQFKLKAGNGEQILISEGYSSKPACLSGVESVRINSQIDSRYDLKTSANGKYIFNLKASNGQIIGISELYESEKGRDNGIESVKKNAKDAPVDDETD